MESDSQFDEQSVEVSAPFTPFYERTIKKKITGLSGLPICRAECLANTANALADNMRIKQMYILGHTF